MWSKGSQIIGTSLLLGKGSNVQKDSTRRRSIETVVRVEVLRKRRNIVIAKRREGTDRDLDQMIGKDSVVTDKERQRTAIVDTREVLAIRNSKPNVKSLKNQKKDSRL